MDPTAPHDTQNPQSTDPSEGGQNQSTPDDLHSQDSQDNSIQPGQFVTAGEDTPPSVSSPKIAQSFQSAGQPQVPQSPNTQQSQTPLPEPSSAPQPAAGLDLASSQFNQNVSPQSSVSQPDPTPFTPPVPQEPTQEVTQPTQGGSKIQKFKIVVVIVAVVALVAIIVALVWFFVLGKQKKEPVKTEQDQVVQEEPSPSPTKTNGGFGDLPATQSAPQPATPSSSQ